MSDLSTSASVTGGRVRPIVRMPDPLLRRAARPCGPEDPGVAEVARDLLLTMAAYPGWRALSAPQIGELLRIVAVDVSTPARNGCQGEGSRGPEVPEGSAFPRGAIVLVNPQLAASDGLQTGWERCLSVPNVIASVRRAGSILVVAFSVDGGTTTLELEGPDAALLLHELDHLDGVLTLDRLQSLSDLSPLSSVAARSAS